MITEKKNTINLRTMCTPSLIPKKKNTFNGSLPPFHGGETNQI